MVEKQGRQVLVSVHEKLPVCCLEKGSQGLASLSIWKGLRFEDWLLEAEQLEWEHLCTREERWQAPIESAQPGVGG